MHLVLLSNKDVPFVTTIQRKLSPNIQPYQSTKKIQLAKGLQNTNTSRANSNNTFALLNRDFSPTLRKGLPTTNLKMTKAKSGRNKVSTFKCTNIITCCVLMHLLTVAPINN